MDSRRWRRCWERLGLVGVCAGEIERLVHGVGPSPMPMERMVRTPASQARARARRGLRRSGGCRDGRASRSLFRMLRAAFENASSAYFRRAPISTSSRNPPGRACRLRAKRQRSFHSTRGRAACGREVGDDDHLASDRAIRACRLRRFRRGSGAFVAEIDFKTEELVGLGHALGDLDLRDAELDLGEVVDGDFFGRRSVLRPLRRCGRRSRSMVRRRCDGGAALLSFSERRRGLVVSTRRGRGDGHGLASAGCA